MLNEWLLKFFGQKITSDHHMAQEFNANEAQSYDLSDLSPWWKI